MNLLNIVGWTLVGIFSLFNLCYYAYKHGQPKDGEYNFWVEVLSIVLNLIIFALVAWR